MADRVIRVKNDGSLLFRSEDHTYWWKDGTGPEVPESWTIQVPSLSRVRQFGGYDLDISKIPPDRLERARARGTAVHEAIHRYFYNEEIEPTIWHPYVKSAISYIEENEILPSYVERPNLDPDLFIASTPDLVDAQATLTDWKTSYEIRDRDLERFWIQFAGEEAALIENGHEVRIWRIVHLTEEDYHVYQATQADKTKARDRYLAAAHHYWWHDPDSLGGNRENWLKRRHNED